MFLARRLTMDFPAVGNAKPGDRGGIRLGNRLQNGGIFPSFEVCFVLVAIFSHCMLRVVLESDSKPAGFDHLLSKYSNQGSIEMKPPEE